MRPLDAAPVALPRWAPLVLTFALLALYVVGFDQGALLQPVLGKIASQGHLHEVFHDARHLLGFPCH